jgi:hypothetical protein
MTVVMHVGRRVPRSWFRAGIQKAKGVLSFQEHIWSIIKQSLNLAKKKANSSNTGIKYVITNDSENEDLNYEIQWIKVIIQGDKKQELEEYEEAMGLYKPFNKVFKKEMPTDDRMKQHFKTKILSTEKIKDAYEKGYGSIGDNNMSNKLLEMGILTHIELIEDYNSRGYI